MLSFAPANKRHLVLWPRSPGSDTTFVLVKNGVVHNAATNALATQGGKVRQLHAQQSQVNIPGGYTYIYMYV